MAYDLSVVNSDDTGATVLVSGAARFGSYGFRDGMRATASSGNGQPLTPLVDGSNNLVRGTAECWIRYHSGTGWEPIFCSPDVSSGLIYSGGGNFVADGVFGSITSTTVTLTDNVWYHIAITWNAGTASIYFNGNRIGTSSNSGAIGSGFRVGGYNPTNSWCVQGGDLDELRISTTNRYTGTTYTVPSAAFTDDSDTVALYHFENDLTNSSGIPMTSIAWTRFN